MKRIRLISIPILLLFLCLMYGCKKEQTDHSNDAKVIFELEGGTYQSSKYPVVHYYQMKEDTILIKQLKELTNADIEYPGYEFMGWYKDKTEVDGKAVYENEWDFTKDRVGKEGVTLYAKWRQKLQYSYGIYALNDDGTETYLCDYEVNAGGTLPYDIKGVSDRDGYTFIRYLDEDKNLWNDAFTHPGGDVKEPIKVYAQYIEGFYKVVRNSKELLDAVKGAGSNIYLAADIDMEGQALYFKNYRRTFLGNNHTISNFAMTLPAGNLKDSLYNNNLYISLFGNITSATIKDVKFTNAKLEVDCGLSQISEIYIAAIASTVTKSTIENVQFDGTYKITVWPDSPNFNKEENFYLMNEGYVEKDEKSIIKNTTIKFIEENN